MRITRGIRRSLAVLAGLALVLPPSATVAATPSPTQVRTAAPVEVTELTAERENNPLGLGAAPPRLGWQLRAGEDARGVVQSAYQVHVASSAEKLAAGDADVWDSGRVESGESTLVEYEGPELTPATRYHWRVKVWDGAGVASDWSDPAWWETGLFEPGDWRADWIGAPEPDVWGDVTIDVELSVTTDAVGVFFRASGAGDAFMWQLANFGGEPTLRPHIRLGGAWTLLDEIPIGDVVPPAEFPGPHRMTIAAEGDTITTRIDGQAVDTRTDARHPTGTFGLRTNGAEAGVVHSVTVTEGDETLFETDFADGINPFTGGTIVEDGLRVSGNLEALLAGDAAPLLRREFTVDKEVASARVHATALGLYELSLNGQPVGDHELAPGWTDYDHRIQHQTYDVTDLVAEGENVFGGMLGAGWYAGHIAWYGTGMYGDRPALLAQLTVEYTDGSTEVVATDSSWRTAPGPLLSSDLLMGERYDARQARNGWDTVGYDDAGWDAAGLVEADSLERVQPQVDPPVRITEELPAQALTEPEPGVWVVDLGQNMVGTVRLSVDGEAGQTVRIRHAEVLNPDGTIYTDNLRSAQPTDHYTLAGGGEEVYEPTFTSHGFRYVELTGFPGEPDLATVTGLVMHTDAPMTSEFETSNPMLNQLHRNITWGQRGNFLSVPTDTPARDERLGWTGDINVFAETAAFNMDTLTFLTKWLTDLRDGQSPEGEFPHVAPDTGVGHGAAGWGDAGVTVPWTLWQRYGDTRVIEENFEAMTRFVDWMERTSDGLLRPNSGPFGDWLNLDDPTPQGVVGTAYFAHSSTLLAQMAAAIGRDAEADHYAALADDVRAAFAAAYVGPDGTVRGDSQTAYVLALGMDLVPDGLREAAANRLVAKIEERDGHLSTGFLGTPDLLPVLTETGHVDVAYQLLLNRTYPSWGYQIDLGATTMWERWDSIRRDGSFQDAGMNSFNHYAYGAVGDWMYRTIGGIEPAEPGYRHTVIDPQPGGGLEHARVGYDSAFGPIASAWRKDGDGLVHEVTVPPNTTADVHVPATRAAAVTESGVPAAEAEGVTFVEMDGDVAVFQVGSGSYTFTADEVLGHAVEARNSAAVVRDHVEQLAADGELDRGERNYLVLRARELDEQSAAAVTAALARDEGTALELVSDALATAGDMVRWIDTQVHAGRLDAEVGASVTKLVAPVRDSLSQASSLLAGVAVTVRTPDSGAVPGAPARVEIEVENTGTSDLTGLAVTLEQQAGWTVTPVGRAARAVPPGDRAVAAFDVVVPSGSPIGPVELAGRVDYRIDGGTAGLPVTGTLDVVSPLLLDAATATPAATGPGGAVTVTAAVSNRGPALAAGTVTLTLPAGWSVPGAEAVEVEAGATATATFDVVAPQDGTAGPAAAGVSVEYGGTTVDTADVALEYELQVPPDGPVDHVDLGDAASEQAHGLRASAGSGTNAEAGLTRRYTNMGDPNGFFEFDVAVPDGPFVLRMIETYDSAQTKDYDIYVDGTLVHARDHQRSASGPGTVVYQIVVGEPAGSGHVAVRFQEDALGANYDPSIADLWVLPAPSGGT